jgi:hypothetical protein
MFCRCRRQTPWVSLVVERFALAEERRSSLPLTPGAEGFKVPPIIA